MLASLPNDVQMTMLRDPVKDWSVGDIKDLEQGLLEEMMAKIRDAYDAIITKRNQNWADQIEIEMKGFGTEFMAVGAGHLVGDEGVPAILTAS